MAIYSQFVLKVLLTPINQPNRHHIMFNTSLKCQIFFNGGSYQRVYQHPKSHCHFRYLLKSYLFPVSVFAFCLLL